MRPLPMYIRPELRYACHRCGACCRSFVVTVSAEEERRLAGQRWWLRGWRFLRGVVTAGVDPWGRPARVLRRRADGRCVLLDDDELCMVQKRFGHTAKPYVCRQFPLVFVRGPDALRVAVSAECVSRHRSVVAGPPLAGECASVEALASAVTPYRTRFRVRLSDPGPLLSTEAYLDLERRIRAALAREPLAAGLALMARSIDATREDVGAAALEGNGSPPREPGAAPRAGLPPAAPAGDEEGVDQVLHAMLPVVAAHAADPGRAPLAEAAQRLSPPGAWRRALAGCDAHPEAAAFLRALLQGWVDEAIPAREPTAAEGVGRMLLGALLCAAPAAGAGPPAGLPAAMNAVARVVSLAFREAGGEALRADLGGYEHLRRAFVRMHPVGPAREQAAQVERTEEA